MTKEILRRVRSRFDFLVREYGFVVAQETYDFWNFGNVRVRFASPDHLVTITIDRGQVFLDIAAAAAPAAGYDLAVILRYLTGQAWSYDFAAEPTEQLAALAGVLKTHAPAIFAEHLVRAHRAELDALVQQQLQERLADLGRGTDPRDPG